MNKRTKQKVFYCIKEDINIYMDSDNIKTTKKGNNDLDQRQLKKENDSSNNFYFD